MFTILIYRMTMVAVEPLIMQAYEEAIQERDMALWKPAKSYRVPLGEAVQNDRCLSRVWTTKHRSMDGTTLVIGPKRKGIYQVHFKTAGCLRHWSAERTAKFSKGIVWLNRAVQGYVSEPFDRLYFVKRNGRLMLIPAGAVEQAAVLAGSTKAGIEFWTNWWGFYADQR